MTTPLRGRPATVQKDRIELGETAVIDLKLMGDGDQAQIFLPGQWDIASSTGSIIELAAVVAPKKGRLPKDGTGTKAGLAVGKESIAAALVTWSLVEVVLPKGWVLSGFTRSVVKDSGRTKLVFVSTRAKKAPVAEAVEPATKPKRTRTKTDKAA